VLVYGPSGTGKTSLVQCGLAKAIPASDYFSMSNSSSRRLAANAGKYPDRYSGRNHKRQIRSPSIAECIRYALRPIYLIFDQLEELFISGSVEEQKLVCRFFKSSRSIVAGV
jgi:energy-coupling factor transporter ATP-binding protein EcfA2